MTGWLPIQKIAADVIRLVPNFESGIFLGTHFDVAYMIYGWVYHVAKLQLVDSSKYVVQNYGKFWLRRRRSTTLQAVPTYPET